MDKECQQYIDAILTTAATALRAAHYCYERHALSNEMLDQLLETSQTLGALIAKFEDVSYGTVPPHVINALRAYEDMASNLRAAGLAEARR